MVPWSQAAPRRPLGEKAHVKKNNDVETKTSSRRGLRLAQKFWAELGGAPGPRWAGQPLKDAAGACCRPDGAPGAAAGLTALEQ